MSVDSKPTERILLQQIMLACATIVPSLLLPLDCMSAAPQAKPQQQTIRVRVEWGGGLPRKWQGLAEISKGTLKSVRSLGLNAHEPRTLWIDKNTLAIQRSTPRIYDGFDIEIQSDETATLTLSLRSSEEPRLTEQIHIPLATLDTKPLTQAVSGSDVQLVVRRTPGDVLSIRPKHKHLIFTPSAIFAADVRLQPLDTQAFESAKEIEWSLSPARSDTVINRGTISYPGASSRRNALTSTTCQIQLPDKEGTYDVKFELAGNKQHLLKSTVQVLVMAATAPQTESIDPNTKKDRLVDSFSTDQKRLKRLIAKPRTSQIVDETFDGIRSLFPSFANPKSIGANKNSEVKWSAYRMHVQNPGRLHRLTIQFSNNMEQSLGASILQPNAAGQLLPVHLDSGMRVSNNATDKSGASGLRSCRHEILFWPKHRQPLLVLHNFGSGSPLPTCNIQMVEVAKSAIGSFAIKNEGSRLGDNSLPRLVGPYMRKPLLPEFFGGSEAYDQQSGRSLDDWTTFHESATHLSDYLHRQEYNSLLLSVFSDGSSIYPSQLLAPTPRYDTGTYSSTGQDPIRKDVLELLFREFDRHNLALVPALQFSTPLPELEKLLANEAGSHSGILLVNRHGQTRNESRDHPDVLAGHYNPLDPRVQNAVRNVVKELVSRYSNHNSFRRVAVEMGMQSYLQLPDMTWGYDEATIDRFSKSTGIQVPQSTGDKNERYRFLTTDVRERWTRWRCEEIVNFHQSLISTIQEINPEIELVLVGQQLVRSDAGHQQADPYEAILSGKRMSTLLIEKGIDFRAYQGLNHLQLVMPTHYSSPSDSLTSASDERINLEVGTQAELAKQPLGHLINHQSQEIRIPEFDQISPWTPAYTWLASPQIPRGEFNRKRYVDTLTHHDGRTIFEGGWSVLLGQEHHGLTLRRAFRRLPDISFYDIADKNNSIVARIAHHNEKTYLYFVNELSEAVHVSLRLKCPSHIKGTFLGTNEPIRLASTNQQTSQLNFEMRPYDLKSIELVEANIHVNSLSSRLTNQSIIALQQSVKRFDNAITRVQHVPQIEHSKIRNAGFEQNSVSLAGWHVPENRNGAWAIDSENPRSGQGSLLLTSFDNRAEAFTSEFDLKSSPTILISSWLRSDQEEAEVRLALELKLNGKTEVHNASVQVDKEWRRYVLRVTDIPQIEIESAKVRIEMRKDGKLWIDDVELKTQQLSQHEQRQITKTYAALNLAWEEKRYADCQRLLNSYWVQRLVHSDGAAGETTLHKENHIQRRSSFLRRLFDR